MVLPDIFSRRKRKLLAEVDVYNYHTCATKLRQQIIFMIRDVSKNFRNEWDVNDYYDLLVGFIRKEIGVERLNGNYATSEEFDEWFRNEQIIDQLIDGIEFSARLIGYYCKRMDREKSYDRFVKELNARMLENCFGYQYNVGNIIQINSEFIHSEVVINALGIISNSEYVTVNNEFREVHKEFRDGNYDDCIHDCCNSFESLLKVILTKKGWSFNTTDTASKLIAVAFANDLIPSYMQAEFTGLRTILESGVPTVRNKDGGHGAGVNPRNIPSHIAAFQLHQTAAAIVLLAEAAK